MLKETSVILLGLAIEIVGSYSGCSTGRQIQEGKRNRVGEGDIFNPKRYSFKRLNFCYHCVFSFSMLLSGVNSPNCENHIGERFKTYDNNCIKSNKPRSLTFVTWCFDVFWYIRNSTCESHQQEHGKEFVPDSVDLFSSKEDRGAEIQK